ncbi:signal recognition particle-docking protein FtsY [Candidatus Woesearchaeota archaeon]|nr:signal recognition particle-docking protein FtsY [Candidatus Woesearchaeota archaeon]
MHKKEQTLPQKKEEITKVPSVQEEEPATEKKSFFGRLKEKIVGKKEEPAPIELKEILSEKQAEVKEALPEKKVVPPAPKKEERTIPPLLKKIEAKVTAAPKPVFKEEIPAIPEKKEQPVPISAPPQEHKPAAAAPQTKEVPVERPTEEKAEESAEKKSFFGLIKEKITKQVISEEKFEELFFDLEMVLLENNVAVEVIDKIKLDLKKEIVDVPITRGKIGDAILDALKKSVKDVLSVRSEDIVQKIKAKHDRPFVMVFVGVNGSGKTTTIAKVVHLLQQKGLKSVIAASDTFRAAAMEQLQKHADALGVKLIKHDYGSDPAAVAFDAIAHAKAKGVDVVMIDTAGRLHSNENLMEELKKVVRVAKPDLTIFIGESITGNDCVEQARQFNLATNIHGIILSKADVDEKGGAALSVSYVTGKPVLYLGTGQRYQDLEPFDPDKIMGSMGL